MRYTLLFLCFFALLACRDDDDDSDGGVDGSVPDADEPDVDTGPPPREGQIAFQSCVGPAGECGGETCCRAENVRSELGPATCSVTQEGEDLVVDFELTGVLIESGIVATGLRFINNDTTPTQVQSCESFVVSNAGTPYPVEGDCTALDVRTDPAGGGCLVEAHFAPNGLLVGRFQCLELVAGADYFSTVGGGMVNWGTFSVSGCPPLETELDRDL